MDSEPVQRERRAPERVRLELLLLLDLAEPFRLVLPAELRFLLAAVEEVFRRELLDRSGWRRDAPESPCDRARAVARPTSLLKLLFSPLEVSF